MGLHDSFAGYLTVFAEPLFDALFKRRSYNHMILIDWQEASILVNEISLAYAPVVPEKA